MLNMEYGGDMNDVGMCDFADNVELSREKFRHEFSRRFSRIDDFAGQGGVGAS